MDIIIAGNYLDSALISTSSFSTFNAPGASANWKNGTDSPIPCISIAPTAMRAGLSSAPPASLQNAFAKGFSGM